MKRQIALGLGALLCWGLGIGAVGRWEAASGPTEYMSMPPAHMARTLGAGFDNMLADGLYLQFISYFGKHMRSDHAYHNLAPALMLITDLDPKFEGAYVMGSLALGDARQFDALSRLWAKAVRENPRSYGLAYQAGMNLFLFGDTPALYAQAAHYFDYAATLPEARPEARFMEARCYDVSHRQDLARRIWQETLATSNSAEAREVARRALANGQANSIFAQ